MKMLGLEMELSGLRAGVGVLAWDFYCGSFGLGGRLGFIEKFECGWWQRLIRRLVRRGLNFLDFLRIWII